MDNKKEDLRIVKTKASLYRGLMALMKEKPFEQIKVSEICSSSYVNRSTFYDHFNDKFELLQSLLLDLSSELTNTMVITNPTNNPQEYFKEMLTILLNHVSENLEIYSAVAKINGNSIAIDMIRDTIVNLTIKDIEKNNINNTDLPTRTFVLFYTSGFISVIADSVKDPKTFDPDKILKTLLMFIPDNK